MDKNKLKPDDPRFLVIMEMIHQSLSNGIRSGKADAPRQWLKERSLSIDATAACFNSGQMHHRRPTEFIETLKSVGFLKESGVNGKKPGNPPAYTSFGGNGMLFPLKNENNQVVNFYGIRFRLKDQPSGFLNEEGIYPSFPDPLTTRVYLVDTVMEAAAILESKILDNRDAVMALFDGELMTQHEKALSKLKELKEVIRIRTTIKTKSDAGESKSVA